MHAVPQLANNGPPTLSSRRALLMRSATYASVAVALTLIVLKLWAWQITDAVSVLSSLADSLLDLLASGLVLFAVHLALTPADREHRFGHGKSEGLAGLAQSVLVAGSALYVATEATMRLIEPQAVREAATGITVMVVAMLTTVALLTFQRFVARHTGSVAIAADAEHYRADLLMNTGVIVAMVLTAYADWSFVDPLFGLAAAVYILFAIRKIAIQSIDILMDRELPDQDRERIAKLAVSHPDVRGIHDLRTRSGGTTHFIQFHLELDPHISLADAHSITEAVEARVKAGFEQAEVLIHADPFGHPEPRDDF